MRAHDPGLHDPPFPQGAGRTTKKEVLEALGSNEEFKRLIEEKLQVMARFGIITIDGEIVNVA